VRFQELAALELISIGWAYAGAAGRRRFSIVAVLANHLRADPHGTRHRAVEAAHPMTPHVRCHVHRCCSAFAFSISIAVSIGGKHPASRCSAAPILAPKEIFTAIDKFRWRPFPSSSWPAT
jgi:hypothetical protein